MKRDRLLPLAALAIPLALSSACALGEGEPFATLRPTFAATFAREHDREAGDGYLRLVSGYEIKVEAASLEVAAIQILASAPGQDIAAFDPANPPEGYSNCHGGHCHASDGSTVDYADIEAERAGGEGSALELALALDLGAPVDLLAAGEPIVLACHSPMLAGCGLGEGTLRRVELAVSSLSFHLLVRDGQVPARAEPRDLDLSIDVASSGGGRFVHALELTAGRRGERSFDLPLVLELGAALFDAIDWSADEPDLHALIHALGHATFEAGARDHEEEAHAH